MIKIMSKNVLVLIIIFLLLGTTIIPTISSSSSKEVDFQENDVISKNSGYIWQQINEDGFGNIHNRGPRGIEIFNNSLVIGTANYNEEAGFIFTKTYLIRLFLYEAFLNSSFSVDALKSDGCEIWCYDGENLRQLVGPYGCIPSGFGNKNNLEVGVLIEFKGYLYAGLRNQIEGCQMWRTNDLENWERVLDHGFGNRRNAAIWDAAVFNDTLYVGTMNFGDGCEIFRTTTGDIDAWEVVVGDKASVKEGFGTKNNFYAWSMCVYDDWLYVGTDNLDGGGELWKSKDGINWRPVLASKWWIGAKLHGADFPRGFTRGHITYRGGIRNMVVYKDELYCGFCGEDLVYDFWLSNMFKLFSKRQQMFRQMLHPLRRFTSLGLEIWKYNSSLDKWTRVVGGIRRGNHSGGFGDVKNEYPWSMHVHDDHLYVGTLRVKPINIVFKKYGDGFPFGYLGIKVETILGGGQLWRYDGEEWQRINENGFGDLYNVGIREMKVYNNSLISATMNIKTGCELWKYDLP